MSAEQLCDRLESVTKRLEFICNNMNSNNSLNQEKASVSSSTLLSDYKTFISNSVTPFTAICKTIGGELSTMGGLVDSAFKAQLDFVEKCLSQAKPTSQPALATLSQATLTAINKIIEYRDSNRKSSFFNHLSAISEAIPALSWVTVEPCPAPYITEMQQSSEFYYNRVLKDFKEKDANHQKWVNLLKNVMTQLHDYVKSHHTTGFCWNKNVSLSSAAVPPPPPPPPPPSSNVASTGAKSGGGGQDELFAQLNCGDAVTKGLKKVTDDKKTHKNPNLRAQPSPAVAPKPGKAPLAVSAPAKVSKAAPIKELSNDKWTIENFEGETVEITTRHMKERVYIYNCVKSTIVVSGKINSIVVDKCKKCGIVFQDVICSMDLVNCSDIKAQVTGQLPIANIDKTDGCQLYLSVASQGCEVISAKSSELNVLVEQAADGEFKEFPIPEQFRSKYEAGGVKTIVNESSG